MVDEEDTLFVPLLQKVKLLSHSTLLFKTIFISWQEIATLSL